MGDRLKKTLRQVGRLDPLEVAIWDAFYAEFDPRRPDGAIGKVLRDRADRRAALNAWATIFARWPDTNVTEKTFMPDYVSRSRKRRKKETAAERDARLMAAIKGWCGVSEEQRDGR